MEDAQFMVGRLRTLQPRLLARYQEVVAQDQLKQWQAHAQALGSEGEQLAEDLALYAEVTPKLVAVFARLAAYRQKLSALYAERPPGVDDIAQDPELVARNLDQFSRDTQSLLDAVTLRDWHSGKEVWPERSSAHFAAAFAQSMAVPPHPGAVWWRESERKTAERQAEAERMAAYYADASKQQELRKNEEERAAFAAQQQRN
jgi:hypothetical protein